LAPGPITKLRRLVCGAPEMPDLHESPTPLRNASFNVSQRENAAVVALEGDLDLVSAPRLKETLTKLLRSGSERLVLDFSGVRFMDSTGLSVLIGVHRRLEPDERLAIAEVLPEVLRVFEMSGITAHFRIFPTLDEALSHVAEGGGAAGAPASPPLTADAALMLGIASTAMPFAQTEEDQAERWLRVLRRHGEAGVVLASLGVREARVRQPEPEAEGEHSDTDGSDAIAAVTEHAGRIASQRRAAKVATTDVLLAAMHVYGATFDRVLAAHGADSEEVAASVATDHPAAA
jgi:anti-sigma B factor antagonist